jgi:hypothetical protein
MDGCNGLCLLNYIKIIGIALYQFSMIYLVELRSSKLLQGGLKIEQVLGNVKFVLMRKKKQIYTYVILNANIDLVGICMLLSIQLLANVTANLVQVSYTHLYIKPGSNRIKTINFVASPRITI